MTQHTDFNARLLPSEARLPMDPSTDVPDGYAPEQRNQPGGFIAAADVDLLYLTDDVDDAVAVIKRAQDERRAAGRSE